MRPKGTSAGLEQRRRAAVAMLREGMKPAAVARTLKVSAASVSRWGKAAREGGLRALAARPTPGRPLKLKREQWPQIVELLLRGPKSFGYTTELWTLARVAEVVQRHLKVEYHPSQLWRILLRLGWSCQKPESRARERDQKAVARWRRVDWPRLKKKPPEKAKACCFWMKQVGCSSRWCAAPGPPGESAP